MKKAAIVIGKPNAGKSTTIREFLKLIESPSLHVFEIDGRHGFTWLTSFEEYDRDVESTVEDCREYDYLVFACQGEKLGEVHRALKKASFATLDVPVQRYTEAPGNAREILKFFRSK
jgi:ABC-type multidrug transport system ATPase subunit